MTDAIPLPKCVFCGADWSEPMVELLSVSDGCETCGYGSSASVDIKIYCSECGRPVYRKTGIDAGY